MTTLPLPTPELKKIASFIVDAIERGDIRSARDVTHYKKYFTKLYSLNRIPSNSELLANIDENCRDEVSLLLRRKAIRTLSGVAIIAVMTSPHPCPHGRCTPCPGGPPHSPQSYSGKEPASLRAFRYNYDPYKQVENRLFQLNSIGHPTDKIDLIVMGGTVPARDCIYQHFFVRRCFDAMNGFKSPTLERAQYLNESAKHRCVGMTIETRPDWCRIHHIDEMLSLGATRIELGVQILDDNILYSIHRGHTVSDIISATRLAKDAGLKICYHIMPGLPTSTEETDLDSFHLLFSDQRFRPDMLKIYPTLVLESSLFYDQWKQGDYKPLCEDEAVPLIAQMKEQVPPWVRIQRVERDIPSTVIKGGIKKSNLRQIIHEYMQQHEMACNCIRCRETGHVNINQYTLDIHEFTLKKREYIASGGKELFLSFENEHSIAAYCRLRIPFYSYFPELERAAIVRELKVHGQMVSFGKRRDDCLQHHGYGTKLLEAAEEQAIRFKKEKLAVLSGVGARNYYRKLGYRKQKYYMMKTIIK